VDNRTKKNIFTGAIVLFLIWVFTRPKTKTAARSALVSDQSNVIQVVETYSYASGAPIAKSPVIPVLEKTITGTESGGESMAGKKVLSFYIVKTNDIGTVKIDFDTSSFYTLTNENETLSMAANDSNTLGYFTPTLQALDGATYKFISIII
jgi:hypothetical protein